MFEIHAVPMHIYLFFKMFVIKPLFKLELRCFITCHKKKVSFTFQLCFVIFYLLFNVIAHVFL